MNFSQIKAKLTDLFNQIERQAANAELPDLEIVNNFSRLCRQMHNSAPDTWVLEAEDFAHLASQLQQAVKKKQTADAILLVDSLQDAWAYCHRTFKD